MAGDDNDADARDRLLPFLGALARLGSSIVAGGTAQLVAAQRHELRRVAAVFALSFAAAVFACAAAGFASYSVLMALGEAHRVLGSALIAGGFALLSGISVLLVRSRPSPA